MALAALNDTHGEPLTDPLLESALNAGLNVQVTAAPGTGGALCFGDSGRRLPQLITQEPEA